MSPSTPVFIFLALGLLLIAWGMVKRHRGARHGAGEALDAEAYLQAGKEQGNPLIVVGTALVIITILVGLASR
jgi:hypothetical protein